MVRVVNRLRLRAVQAGKVQGTKASNVLGQSQGIVTQNMCMR